jgi:hypothetical protein
VYWGPDEPTPTPKKRRKKQPEIIPTDVEVPFDFDPTLDQPAEPRVVVAQPTPWVTRVTLRARGDRIRTARAAFETASWGASTPDEPIAADLEAVAFGAAMAFRLFEDD